MSNMSYEYIAGFFDADGSVGLTKGRPFVNICQATQYESVLYAIQEFLASEGIECGVYQVTQRPTQFATNHQMSTLKFNSIDHMTLFLQTLIPLLYVKKKRSQDVLIHIQNSNFATPANLAARLEKAVLDYQGGMSAVKAAATNKTSWKRLRQTLVQRGIEVRSASMAKKLWWKSMPEDKQNKIKSVLRKHKMPNFGTSAKFASSE